MILTIEPETMDEEDIEISEREVKVMLETSQISGVRSKVRLMKQSMR